MILARCVLWFVACCVLLFVVVFFGGGCLLVGAGYSLCDVCLLFAVFLVLVGCLLLFVA